MFVYDTKYIYQTHLLQFKGKATVIGLITKHKFCIIFALQGHKMILSLDCFNAEKFSMGL